MRIVAIACGYTRTTTKPSTSSTYAPPSPFPAVLRRCVWLCPVPLTCVCVRALPLARAVQLSAARAVQLSAGRHVSTDADSEGGGGAGGRAGDRKSVTFAAAKGAPVSTDGTVSLADVTTWHKVATRALRAYRAGGADTVLVYLTNRRLTAPDTSRPALQARDNLIFISQDELSAFLSPAFAQRALPPRRIHGPSALQTRGRLTVCGSAGAAFQGGIVAA